MNYAVIYSLDIPKWGSKISERILTAC